jgi:hypothetical protein
MLTAFTLSGAQLLPGSGERGPLDRAEARALLTVRTGENISAAEIGVIRSCARRFRY